MFTPIIRYVLIFFALLVGGYHLFNSNLQGWGYILAAIVLFWSHFRSGNVWRAWKAYENNDMEKVRNILSSISKPEWLSTQNKAYYHWLNGVALADNDETKDAYLELKIASKGPLRTENAQSVVNFYLADLALQLNKIETAKKHISKAKSLNHNSELDINIQEIERKIADVV